MNLRNKLQQYTGQLAEKLEKSPNALFEEHPEIIERLRNEKTDSAVDNVKIQLLKILQSITRDEEAARVKIGSFSFEWDDSEHDSFDVYLCSDNEFDEWGESDLGDFGVIDMKPLLESIFQGIENRNDELHDNLDDMMRLMTAVVETAIMETVEEGGFSALPCKDPFIISIRLWHDIEKSLIFSSDENIDNTSYYRELDFPPEIKPNQAETMVDETISRGFKWLRIEDLGIGSVPEKIAILEKLETVSFARNRIRELPDSLWNHKSIIELNLSRNKIGEISGDVGRLENCKILDLSSNELKSVPEEIGSLHNLERLHLGYNSIEELPDLSRCRSLTMLELNNNRLSKVPALPESLEWLQLLDNRLSALQPSMSSLKKLTHIILANNSFSEVPEELLELENLESITLGGNPIKDLPEELMKLPSLREISIVPNMIPVEKRKELMEKFGKILFLGYDTDEGFCM